MKCVPPVLLSASLLAVIACERPPVAGVEQPEPETPEGDVTIDIAAFAPDTPVIGADWYDYDFTSHVLTPTNQSYVVRIAGTGDDRYAAFRPASYYDEQTGDSGVFTLQLTTFVDDAWTAPFTLTLSKNVKTADICVDLLEQREVECGGGHLRVETNPRLIPEAGLVVAEPSFSLPSVAGIAALDLVDGVIVPGALSALPAPSAVTGFAPHVPVDGMALGCDVVDEGKTRFMVVGRERFAKVVLGTTAIRFAMSTLDLTGPTATPFGDDETLTIGAPTTDEARAILLADTGTVTSLPTPQLTNPPAAKDYSFILYKNDDNQTCALLSPAVAVATVDAAFDDAVVPRP